MPQSWGVFTQNNRMCSSKTCQLMSSSNTKVSDVVSEEAPVSLLKVNLLPLMLAWQRGNRSWLRRDDDLSKRYIISITLQSWLFHNSKGDLEWVLTSWKGSFRRDFSMMILGSIDVSHQNASLNSMSVLDLTSQSISQRRDHLLLWRRSSVRCSKNVNWRWAKAFSFITWEMSFRRLTDLSSPSHPFITSPKRSFRDSLQLLITSLLFTKDFESSTLMSQSYTSLTIERGDGSLLASIIRSPILRNWRERTWWQLCVALESSSLQPTIVSQPSASSSQSWLSILMALTTSGGSILWSWLTMRHLIEAMQAGSWSKICVYRCCSLVHITSIWHLLRWLSASSKVETCPLTSVCSLESKLIISDHLGIRSKYTWESWQFTWENWLFMKAWQLAAFG